MDELTGTPPLLSVQILLPDGINRRLERWTEEMPGTSWPTWGGHITLVPNFVPRATVGEVRASVAAVCAQVPAFNVRFAAPVAVQDSTRPDYYIVFLTVEEALADGEEEHLHKLRNALLAALDGQREDIRPKLVEQPFVPHVTLAIGLGELEARKLAQEMRAEPLVAEFKVEAIWLVMQTVGEGAKFERQPIPLAKATPVTLSPD
jgi:2'-5' RNA ligase